VEYLPVNAWLCCLHRGCFTDDPNDVESTVIGDPNDTDGQGNPASDPNVAESPAVGDWNDVEESTDPVGDPVVVQSTAVGDPNPLIEPSDPVSDPNVVEAPGVGDRNDVEESTDPVGDPVVVESTAIGDPNPLIEPSDPVSDPNVVESPAIGDRNDVEESTDPVGDPVVVEPTAIGDPNPLIEPSDPVSDPNVVESPGVGDRNDVEESTDPVGDPVVVESTAIGDPNPIIEPSDPVSDPNVVESPAIGDRNDVEESTDPVGDPVVVEPTAIGDRISVETPTDPTGDQNVVESDTDGQANPTGDLNVVDNNNAYDNPVTVVPETVECVEDSCDSAVIPILAYPNLSVFLEQDDGQCDNSQQPMTDKNDEVGSSEQPKIYVKCSNNVNGKRVFDKKHYCLFCDRSSTNLTKHLLNVHDSEKFFQDVLRMPKNSKERKHMLEQIRNMGDYKHNCDVRSKGEGEIIPWRSPPEPVPASDFVPCPDCFAFFQHTHLWRHHRECTFCTRAGRQHAFRSLKVEAELLLPSNKEMSRRLREIMASMRKDQFSLIMKNDTTIIKYGEKLVQKYGHLQHLHQHIGCKMRELARLLVAAREHDQNVTWLADLLCPGKFDGVVRAVKSLCGFSDESKQYNIPSLALKIGHSLKKCCAIIICASIKHCDEQKRKSADDFMYLCEKEWTVEIASAAISTLTAMKMNKPQLLPFTEDIQKLNSFLIGEADRCVNELKSDKNVVDNWQDLAKVTLAAIIVFNRKRAGEAERMLLDDYNARDVNPLANKDILNSLTEVEKVLCQRMTRVEIRGKRGRTVPVILTPRLVGAMDLLAARRSQVGITDDNKFMFAKPSSNHPLRGSDCLRKMAVAAGTRAEHLTSTCLRKHIATTSQILNLQETELDLLAGFLGHDLHIHRTFYRLPQDTLQLAKVSKILIAYDSGQIASYKGKSLDDIPVEGDVLDVNEDDSDSDNEASQSREKIPNATREQSKTERTATSNRVIESDSDEVHKRRLPDTSTSTARLKKRARTIKSNPVIESDSDEAHQRHLPDSNTTTANFKKRARTTKSNPVIESDSDEAHQRHLPDSNTSTANFKKRARTTKSNPVIENDSDEVHQRRLPDTNTSTARLKKNGIHFICIICIHFICLLF